MIQKILISLGICIVLWALVYFLVMKPLIRDVRNKPKQKIQQQDEK